MAANLRMGSRGRAVEELQQALNAAPSRQARLNPDGQFGRKTNARVAEFQAQNQLAPDGVVGPLTYDALEPFLKGLSEIVDHLIVSPEDELAARKRIVDNAKRMYALHHWGPGFQLSRAVYHDILAFSARVVATVSASSS
jgi:peptidoglycan hydrolase-like protein with peptidoglycan-binding domain